MSAVFGFLHLSGRPADPSDLGRMDARLAHRGRDRDGRWIEGPVALGHRMLHTTPESIRERAPLLDPGSGVVVTADARVDNREELLASLGMRHDDPAGVSDGELVLRAYLRWGPEGAKHLLGDFSYALWDPRERLLIAVRDPIGVRSLYYYHGRGLFAFASEIGALWGLESIPRRPNEQAIADFLVPWFEDEASTLWEGVQRLPPAHLIEVRPSGVKLTQYWALDPSPGVSGRSSDGHVEAFLDAFTESVRCRLRSVDAVGSTLSGGLDSSSVACVAARLIGQAGSGQALHTVTAVFPIVSRLDPRADERAYIDAVLASGNGEGAASASFVPHYVEVDAPGSLWSPQTHADTPLALPNAYLTLAVLEAAGAAGVGVLLSGFDGDATVSYGYEYLVWLAEQGLWGQFAKEARALEQRQSSVRASTYLRRFGFPSMRESAERGQWGTWMRQAHEVSRSFDLSLWRLFRGTGAGALVPQWAHRLRRGSPDEPWSQWNGAIRRSFARRAGLPDRVRETGIPLPSTQPDRPGAAAVDGLTQHLFGMYDVQAGRSGVDQRYPFFDRRLVELCVALPLQERLGEGWTRWILRRAMEGILPPAVQRRLDKGNIGGGIRHRLHAERGVVEDVLADPERISPYIEIGALAAAYRRFAADPMKAQERDVFTLFLGCSLACWLRDSDPVDA